MKKVINKMKYIKAQTFFCAIVLILIISSCSKMKDNYKKYIADGEIVYTSKVDSLKTYSGKNRIKLTWLLVSDPKITLCKVFWNDGLDSISIPVQKTGNVDTISTIINDLKEGLYAFDIYTYDNAGHSSIKTEVTSSVYGDNYKASIFNRALDSAEYHQDSSFLAIKWFGVAQQAVLIDLDYTDTLGQPQSLRLIKTSNNPAIPLAFADTTLIRNIKDSTTFRYRTAYLPDANAIDTFFTDYKEIMPTLFVPPTPPSAVSNLALGTLVTASSSTTQALTDGDRSNSKKWQPSSGERADLNVWFYIDLTTSMDFNTTQIYFTKDPGKITYYEVLYTADDEVTSSTKWTRAFIKLESPDAEDINNFKTTKARYIKVNIGLKDASTNINVSEIEVYNNH